MAYFFAAMGSAAMIIVLNYDDSLSRLIRDMPDGLGASALLGSVFIAATIESTFWLLSTSRAHIVEGSSPHAKTLGEQSDER